MKREFKMQDFWEYVARIQEEVTNEVLNQTTEEERYQCMETVNDYMFNLRNMQVGVVSAFTRGENKYIKLVNEALAKRNIFIASNYIHISIC